MSRKFSRKWVSCGYLAKSKTGNVTIMIADGEEKQYYVADLTEALQVLTGNLAYTKIFKRKHS